MPKKASKIRQYMQDISEKAKADKAYQHALMLVSADALQHQYNDEHLAAEVRDTVFLTKKEMEELEKP